MPDDSLYNTVIDRLCNQWKFDTGMKLYNEIERKGMLPSISSYMSLIRVLLKNCRKEEFNEIMNKRNLMGKSEASIKDLHFKMA